MRKIKVCNIIGSLPIGGSERVLLRLLNSINKNEFEVSIISLAKVNEFKEEIKRSKAQYYYIDSINKKNIWRGVIMLRRLIRKINPDIIQVWNENASLWGRVASFGMGKKIIASKRNSKLVSEVFYVTVEKILERFTDLYIANSKSVSDFIIREGVPPNKVIIIENLIDINDFRKSDDSSNLRKQLGLDDCKTIGVVARHHKLKRHDIFLRMARLLLDKDKKIKFLIVGDGPDRKNVEGLVKQLKLENNVILTGFRKDIPKILSAIDISVLCSDFEGLPNSLIESMAVGVPIVARRVTGVVDLVDGKNGLLVDNEKEMAEAILRLLNDKNLRKNMIREQKNTIKRFEPRKIAGEYEQVYRKLLK